MFISSWKKKKVKFTGLFTQLITDHPLYPCCSIEDSTDLKFQKPPLYCTYKNEGIRNFMLFI